VPDVQTLLWKETGWASYTTASESSAQSHGILAVCRYCICARTCHMRVLPPMLPPCGVKPRIAVRWMPRASH